VEPKAQRLGLLPPRGALGHDNAFHDGSLLRVRGRRDFPADF
jgi:hypothetical protein